MTDNHSSDSNFHDGQVRPKTFSWKTIVKIMKTKQFSLYCLSFALVSLGSVMLIISIDESIKEFAGDSRKTFSFWICGPIFIAIGVMIFVKGILSVLLDTHTSTNGNQSSVSRQIEAPNTPVNPPSYSVANLYPQVHRTTAESILVETQDDGINAKRSFHKANDELPNYDEALKIQDFSEQRKGCYRL